MTTKTTPTTTMTAAAVGTATTATNQANLETGDHPNKEEAWTYITRKKKKNSATKSITVTTVETTAKATTEAATEVTTASTKATVTQSPASSHKKEKEKQHPLEGTWTCQGIYKGGATAGTHQERKILQRKPTPTTAPATNPTTTSNSAPDKTTTPVSSTNHTTSTLKTFPIPKFGLWSSTISNTALPFTSQAVLSVSFRN